jgi:hypothetical protein
MLVCVFFAQFAHETAGAARIRLSQRPLIGGREINEYLAQKTCGEIAKLRLAVIARSVCDEAIHTFLAARWITSLRSQ